MNAEPQKEHQWLQKLVGQWTFETECSMGPDQPAEKHRGTESVRSLGGLWIVAEGSVEMPGCGTATNIMMLGYDPQAGRYVGTFVASMMSYLWIYSGSLDAAGKVLTLDAEGPSMSGEGTAKYKDAIEFLSDDHRILTSRLLGDDGKWEGFMIEDYRR